MVQSKSHDKPTDDRYIAALEGLHTAFALALGKPIHAPLDLEKSGLTILDSGCNNGRWLFDLEHECSPASHHFVGTDLLDVFFPSEPKPCFEFAEQDICKPWPPSWNGRFDLVHQRTVLVNARKQPVIEVLSGLKKVLKPGGWMQLMEGDFQTIDGNGPALREFLDLGAWFFDIAGPGRAMGPNLKLTMIDLGLQDVGDEIVYVAIGDKLRDHGRKVVEGSIEGLCAAIPGSLEIIRGMEHPFAISELESLESRLRQELLDRGGCLCYRVAWGMRLEA